MKEFENEGIVSLFIKNAVPCIFITGTLMLLIFNAYDAFRVTNLAIEITWICAKSVPKAVTNFIVSFIYYINI